MKQIVKIFLLVLAIFPLWLTIVALGASPDFKNTLKNRLNTELLKKTDRRIQVLEIYNFPKELEGQDLKAKFEIDLSGIQKTATSALLMKFKDAEGRLSKVYRIAAKTFVEELAAVATRGISRGDTIQDGDFKMEWRDASQFQSNPLRPQDLIGRTLRLDVRDGEPFYETSLVKESLVSKGDRVVVSVKGSGLNLSVVAVAQEPGVRGQTIKVMNLDSKKEFLAVVTASKGVEINL